MESEIIIGPKDFEGNEIIYRKLFIDRNNKSLVIGHVENEKHIPINNATIVICEELIGDSTKNEIGFAISDESGNFRVILEGDENKNYVLEILYPIISNFI